MCHIPRCRRVTKAAVTTTIRLRFDHRSTPIRLQFERATTIRRSTPRADCCTAARPYVNKLCGRPPRYVPAPLTLTFDLLTLKVVFESRVTWAPSAPILVFLGRSVLDIDPMYATDRHQSSNGYCRPDVLRRIGLVCSVINSLQRVWNCSNLSISTKVHLYRCV